MTKREHFLADDPDVRITAEATNLDFLAYKQWTASTRRERRTQSSFLGFTYDTWIPEDPAHSFGAQWQDGAGNLINSDPVIGNGTGHRSAMQLYFFAGGPAPTDEPVSSIESMRMTYEVDRETFELVEGRNWFTVGLSILLLIVVIIALVALGIFVLAAA